MRAAMLPKARPDTGQRRAWHRRATRDWEQSDYLVSLRHALCEHGSGDSRPTRGGARVGQCGMHASTLTSTSVKHEDTSLMQDAVAAGSMRRFLPRLEPNKDCGVGRRKLVSLCRAVGWPFGAASAVQGAWTLITCNLVSLIGHRYVDCVTTDSGCDGGGKDHGIARGSNTAFAQRRATRTPQQVACKLHSGFLFLWRGRFHKCNHRQRAD